MATANEDRVNYHVASFLIEHMIFEGKMNCETKIAWSNDRIDTSCAVFKENKGYNIGTFVGDLMLIYFC